MLQNEPMGKNVLSRDSSLALSSPIVSEDTNPATSATDVDPTITTV